MISLYCRVPSNIKLQMARERMLHTVCSTLHTYYLLILSLNATFSVVFLIIAAVLNLYDAKSGSLSGGQPFRN